MSFARGLAEYVVLADGVAGPIDVPCGYGEIVQLFRSHSFKLGVVLGPSRSPGKTRVCSWIATSRRFSIVTRAVPNRDIAAIVDTSRFSAQQRAIYNAARAASKVLRG